MNVLESSLSRFRHEIDAANASLLALIQQRGELVLGRGRRTTT
jgi:chorismate mutase